ncbi:hypothetical protein BGX31_010104 [Mortierella sp. GBA43]|nr:hypothetical protein BGX31_010104 [Mortierella sp. GBA43]
MLSVYDPKSKVTVSASSATAATSLTDVGAVWLNSRNTILTFGGSRAPPASTQGLGSGELNEYDPASKTWNTMSTSGDVPPARLDHCMAASDDGSKVVVFGGTSDNLNEYFNTIYVLDVKNGKWKQGQSASVARTRMACAFHSSQFIAWGGSSSSSRTTMLNNIPIVYNLNNNKWTDNYNADETPKASSSSSNVGKLVGALVAMFVIAIGVGYFVMKKRQKRKQAEEDAYRSDALTAAAIQSREDVLHDDSNIKVQVNSIYGNIYAMSPMDSQGYASAHSNGSEKVNSSPYSYSTGTPRTAQQSPQAVFAQHDGASNPFSSPDDFTHPPTSHYGSPYSAQSTTFYAPPPTSSTKSDPFQVPYSPAYSQTTTYYGQSPTPGARSPQVIPETATSDDQHHHDNQRGYVPPPM